MNQTTVAEGGGNTALIVIVIIILLVGGYFIFVRGKSMPANDDNGGVNINVDLPAGNGAPTNDNPNGGGMQGGIGY